MWSRNFLTATVQQLPHPDPTDFTMDRSKFLVHLVLFLGLCLATGVVIYVTTSEPEAVEALLKVDRPMGYDDDELTEFDIQTYRDTQASLLNSKFVIANAMRNNEINQLPIIRNLSKHPVEQLSSMVEVHLGKDKVMGVRIPIPWYRRSEVAQWEKVLNAVIDAYLTEVVNKERIEVGDQLAKLRHRYNQVKQMISKKGDELRAYQGVLGSGPEDHWMVEYTTRKVELLDNRLLDLQLQQMTSELRGYEAAEKAIIAKQIEFVTSGRDQHLQSLSRYGGRDGTAEVMKQEVEALKADLLALRLNMRKLEDAIDGSKAVQVLQKATASFSTDSPSYAEIARSLEE